MELRQAISPCSLGRDAVMLIALKNIDFFLFCPKAP